MRLVGMAPNRHDELALVRGTSFEPAVAMKHLVHHSTATVESTA